MCGLIAAVSRSKNGFSNNARNVFEFLTFLDTLRGDDSTGIMLVHNNGNVDIAKSLDDGTQFIKKPEYKSLHTQSWTTGWAMVGHNRKATRGATVEENAHPFWVDNKIVLVHNGTHIGDHKHLANVEVDSHAIAHVLADAHTPEEIEAVMQKVNAAYALIWYDVQNKCINILRNDERPLHCLDTSDAIYFASEPWMLQVAAMRYGIKTENRPFSLRENVLHRLVLNEDRSTTVQNFTIDPKYRRVGSTFFQGSQSQYDDEYWAQHPFACAHSRGDCGEDPRESNSDFEARLRQVAGRTNSESRAVAEAITEATETAEKEARQAAKDRKQIDSSQIFSRDTAFPGARYVEVGAVLEALGHKYTETMFKDHPTVSGSYAKGDRVKVEIVGLTEADDNPKTDNFYLVGQTVDRNKAYVAFQFKTRDFDALIKMDRRTEFTVEVDSVTWTRLNVHGSTDMQDWGGISIVHAKHPVALPPVKDTHVVH